MTKLALPILVLACAGLAFSTGPAAAKGDTDQPIVIGNLPNPAAARRDRRIWAWEKSQELGELPAPPRIAASQASGPKAPGRGTYSNNFECIPDSVAGRTARGTRSYNPETLTRTLSPRHGDGSVKTMLRHK
jgi:uncharacterized protein involved in type VI secretion and phage assembly